MSCIDLLGLPKNKQTNKTRLSSLNNRNLFFTVLDARSLPSRCLQNWFCHAPLWLTNSHCVLRWSFLCVCCLCPNLFLYSHIGLRSIQMAILTYYLFKIKALSPNTEHYEVLGVRVSTYKFWVNIIQPIIWAFCQYFRHKK